MANQVLAGKTGVVFGVANKRSIAWAVAQAWHQAGAKLIFSYQGERLKDNVAELTSEFGEDVALAPCDVTKDEEMDAFFEFVRTKTDKLDMMLHSVAFAPREALDKPFLETTRDAFLVAHEVSAYSLVALSKRAVPLMTDGGSITTMTFRGAQKVYPNYNVMGVAKAALEASVRYLAYELGAKKIRVNAISAGPVQTLAARGIADFSTMMNLYKDRAPLGRSCEPSELGQTAVFLASDGGSGMTGQTLFVDGGYDIMGK
jgi:enoyl-[acyl-carrier protein] reductase I